jgi:hypothetical protein
LSIPATGRRQNRGMREDADQLSSQIKYSRPAADPSDPPQRPLPSADPSSARLRCFLTPNQISTLRTPSCLPPSLWQSDDAVNFEKLWDSADRATPFSETCVLGAICCSTSPPQSQRRSPSPHSNPEAAGTLGGGQVLIVIGGGDVELRGLTQTPVARRGPHHVEHCRSPKLQLSTTRWP